VLAENDGPTSAGAQLHPTEKTIQAVSFTYAKTEWKVLDPERFSPISIT
jgi:hypothetical protein